MDRLRRDAASRLSGPSNREAAEDVVANAKDSRLNRGVFREAEIRDAAGPERPAKRYADLRGPETIT